MIYTINPTKSLVRPKTTESDVEHGDLCTESYAIRLYLESVVDELHDMLHHGVTDPVAIHKKVARISDLDDEYAFALFKEGHDPSKAMKLVGDE